MEEIHRELLSQLKSTVEGLLTSQVTNVWQVYGGLNRLHNVVYKIFNNGCKMFNNEGELDCWPFIQGLSWLQPSLASSPSFLKENASTWILKSLESRCLSGRLAWLVSDEAHLAGCYARDAFLRQPRYGEAALVCLRAVEQQQLTLLTDIHPTLFLSKWKTHRRCASFPDAMPRQAKPRASVPSLDTELAVIASSQAIENARPVEIHRPWRSLPNLFEIGDAACENGIVRQPKSAPVLRRPCTLPSSPAIHPVRSPRPEEGKSLSPSVLKIDYKQLQKEPPVAKGILKNKGSKNNVRELIVLKEVTKSTPIVISKNARRGSDRRVNEQNVSFTSSNGSSDIIDGKNNNHKFHEISNSIYEETDSSFVETVSEQSFPKKVRLKSGGVRYGLKSNRRKSFMDSGGNSVQPMSTGFFPRPTQGQSLASFLSSGQFANTKAELDRENAHFAISEAMIAAIEQVKFNLWTKVVDDTIEESDEEINRLKQRIRLRRWLKQEEKRRSVIGLSLLSDGKTDTTTDSVSPLSSSVSGSSDSLSTEGVDDLELDDNTSATNLSQLNQSGLSLSLASLFSDAELSRPSDQSSSLTAEGVALALLRRFNDKQLPRASEIQWVVNAQEACGQGVLPLPSSSWPVSTAEAEAEDQDMRQATLLRGTTDWAPPRPQVIFTQHPQPQRRVLMAKQNHRCAGCGMTVAPQYASKFRYCEYLGRYFCTGCHTNQLAVIPGRVLSKWDFTRCAVSNFSYRLLDQMAFDPLFNINDLNANLYYRIRPLDKTRVYRLQLCYLKDFLNTCRFAKEKEGELHDFFRTTPPYFISDPHIYSLQDLIQIKEGDMSEKLRELVQTALSHVEGCVLCQGRGFVCEVCNAPEVIFPWQLTRVQRCSACGNCVHLACHQPDVPCQRCARINTRRKNSIVQS